jgi:hypothetical protein
MRIRKLKDGTYSIKVTREELTHVYDGLGYKRGAVESCRPHLSAAFYHDEMSMTRVMREAIESASPRIGEGR